MNNWRHEWKDLLLKSSKVFPVSAQENICSGWRPCPRSQPMGAMLWCGSGRTDPTDGAPTVPRWPSCWSELITRNWTRYTWRMRILCSVTTTSTWPALSSCVRPREQSILWEENSILTHLLQEKVTIEILTWNIFDTDIFVQVPSGSGAERPRVTGTSTTWRCRWSLRTRGPRGSRQWTSAPSFQAAPTSWTSAISLKFVKQLDLLDQWEGTEININVCC